MIILFCCFLFVMILGHGRNDPHASVSLQYRNQLLGNMTAEEKKTYAVKYSLNHLYVMKFFEYKYMDPKFIHQYPGYDQLRENFLIHKYSMFLARYPWCYRYQRPRAELSAQQAQNEWNKYKNKHYKLFKNEKWPVFLQWIMHHPEEWQVVDQSDGKLHYFYQVYQDATQRGLVPDEFVDCIVTDWKTSSLIVTYQDSYNFTVFDLFIQSITTDNLSTSCVGLLETVLKNRPLTEDEKSEYMKNWKYDDLLIPAERIR